jgi:predicted DNA-binding protein (MmcQ/YjbR family)
MSKILARGFGARQAGRPIFVRARRLCLAFPETTEKTSWGHPNFRAGKKTFCALEIFDGRPSIAFRLSRADVNRAVRSTRFFVTPYGRGLWASMWLDGHVNWKAVEAVLERSYRLVATKRLTGILDSTARRRSHRAGRG